MGRLESATTLAENPVGKPYPTSPRLASVQFPPLQASARTVRMPWRQARPQLPAGIATVKTVAPPATAQHLTEYGYYDIVVNIWMALQPPTSSSRERSSA